MDVANRVGEIIDYAGRSITFRRVTHAAYDTATLKPGTATTTDTLLAATVKNYSARQLGNNPMLQEGDRKVIIAATALSAAPTKNDKIIVATKQYNIVTVDELAAFDQVTHYVLQVRG